ncbi:MAG: DUF3500 domain-containing protein [Betaproteobacteria bacterium]|nr:DUF3500 domain-containing protein [Betaproteobacteria bacterium]
MPIVFRTLFIGLLACTPLLSTAHDGPHSTAAAAAGMRDAATAWLATLTPVLRKAAVRAFDDADRFDWHFVPRSRNGLSLKEMDATQRAAAHALLKRALSAAGHAKVTNIIELEGVLREIETFGSLRRDPEKYHLTVYGQPDAKAKWGWRFEGHHLSLNFTLAGDRLVVDTPSFLGANPAEVKSGPKAGLRALKQEEDLARELLASLTPEQRRIAHFDARTYGDIVTGAKEVVAPLAPVGLAAAQMTETQKTLLVKLISEHANTFEPGLATARLARVSHGRAGTEAVGIDAIRFGWAGGTERGQPHYYRIQGPLFLIEYDSSQSSGNHIHTVWRDFTGDFGRDLLREHYSDTKGTGHKHQ